MPERTLWQPGGPSDASLLEEPSDPEKEWDPGELPPAEWENWFKRQVTLDMQDIAETILLDAGSDSGALQVPVEIGDTRHSRIYTEVSGAGDIAIAFNAKYDSTNDDWLEHDSGANNPFLLVFNPSLSGITGISSSDLENENGLHLFEAASISSSVITWQLADIGLDRVDAVNLGDRNYLEPGGGVISNNSSNPNTQIDNTSIKLWVRDFSGGGRIVELPARSPAFDITVSGFNGTTGGLINGSSQNATDWYEFAVIASESDDTLDPIVVGYTIHSTDNRPQSASDLPGNYDLFRPMGDEALTWVALTDGNSDIRPFNHYRDGKWQLTQSERETLGAIYNDSSPALNQNNTLSLPVEAMPPGKYEVGITVFENADGTGNDRLAISNEVISSPNYAGYVIAGGDSGSNNSRGTGDLIIDGQEINWWANNSQKWVLDTIRYIKGVEQ